MPHIDDDQYILNAHFLQLGQQFLAAAFLCSILVALLNELILIFGLESLIGLRDTVCENLSLCRRCL